MKPCMVFTATLSTCAMMAIAGFGFSDQAHAFNIAGNTTGKWGIPIAEGINTEPLYTGVDTNSFSWGEAPDGEPNQLIFQGDSFSGATNSWLKIGNLNYYNGIVYTGTSVDIVPLNLQLSLTDNQNNIQLSKDFSIYFNLINTPNVVVDNIKDPQNADFVEIDTNLTNSSFIFDNHQYQFELKGFSQNGDKSISALEGDTSSTDIYARIRPDSPSQNVPEPPTIAGSLLLGTYLAYRKISSKATTKS